MADIVKVISNQVEICAIQAQAASIAANAKSTVPPGTFVFTAFFDGTNNIETDPRVANDVQSTAIGALYEQAVTSSNTFSVPKYYAGVGTPGTLRETLI